VIARVIFNAYRNDPHAFIDRLRAFGLSEPLGIDLEGEKKPTMHTPGSKYWSGLSLAWMAIGYEYQQTPLQTLAFYNAVANNGILVKPQFVEQVRRGSQIVKNYRPQVLRQKICSDRTLRQLQECLSGVVKRGTGSDLKSSLFDIAGKTGTAVILNDNLRYGAEGEKRYQASFVGYFPAKEPLYSCIVVVSAPNKDIYGATVSGTVFTAIANKVYSNTLKYHQAVNEAKQRVKEVPQSIDGNSSDILTVLNTLRVKYSFPAQTEWANTRANGYTVDIAPRNVSKRSVPNVIGLSARDAVYLVERLGMHAYLKGYGKVVSQSAPAGSPAYTGGLIELGLK
jgi:cell division protein FtsI (penicillin-binding protein 3)